MGFQTQIKNVALIDMAKVLLKKIVNGNAMVVGKDGATHTKVQIVGAAQIFLVDRAARHDAVEFLEQLVTVLYRCCSSLFAKPIHEETEGHLTASRHIKGFDQLTKRHERHIL